MSILELLIYTNTVFNMPINNEYRDGSTLYPKDKMPYPLHHKSFSDYPTTPVPDSKPP
jgi:hypothetical protein